VISLVSLIILLGVLIFVHEFGHFIMARRFGVGILKFSLGFGPPLFSKRIGETEYLISLIPLGGYVKLLGESPEEELTPEEAERSFLKQTAWKKIGIVAAGPIFNFLLAILIFTVVFIHGLPVLKAKVGSVQPDSAAYKAGLLSGDEILSIDNSLIKQWQDIAERISKSKGYTVLIKIKRRSQIFEVEVKPEPHTGKNIFGETITTYKIGITPANEYFVERLNPFSSLVTAIERTWQISQLTILSVIKIIKGTLSPRTLGGPIMIAQMAGTQLREGITPFILFMAVLSINLGVLNLLPIPVLDGGHLLFYFIELVFRREINIKWREKAQQVGFVLLILLMLFVLWMDVEKLDLQLLKKFEKVINR